MKRTALRRVPMKPQRIGSLHDLSCAGPDDCTCTPIGAVYPIDLPPEGAFEPIRKPTPRVKVPKLLKSRPHVIPAGVRETVLERANRTCQWCEVPGGALDCHHVLPRSRGGADRADNLVAVHRLCHGFIHANPSAGKSRGFVA